MIYFLIVKSEIDTEAYLRDLNGTVEYLGALNGRLCFLK